MDRSVNIWRWAMPSRFLAANSGKVHEIYGTKNNVIMDMTFINMGGKNILIPTFCYGVCKLFFSFPAPSF